MAYLLFVFFPLPSTICHLHCRVYLNCSIKSKASIDIFIQRISQILTQIVTLLWCLLSAVYSRSSYIGAQLRNTSISLARSFGKVVETRPWYVVPWYVVPWYVLPWYVLPWYVLPWYDLPWYVLPWYILPWYVIPWYVFSWYILPWYVLPWYVLPSVLNRSNRNE